MSMKTGWLKNVRTRTAHLLTVSIVIVCALITAIYPFKTAGAVESAQAEQNSAQRLAQYAAVEQKLKGHVFSSDKLEQTVNQELVSSYGHNGNFVVFLSLCNAADRATVISATGETLEQAWENASIKAKAFVTEKAYNTVWLKADIVNDKKRILTADLPAEINKKSGGFDEFFRLGIAFDNNFNTALLETEINGNKLIDYDVTGDLDLEEVNEYLSLYERDGLEKIPDALILFSCRGYIYDGTGCYTLNYKQDYNYGRRLIEEVTGDYAGVLMDNSTKFLVNSIQEDGSFIYGMYPTYDKQIPDYNILRHAGTTGTLVTQFDAASGESHKNAIESSIGYLLGEIEYDYKAGGAAYVVERKSNEIKLGGNGIAVCALVDYMEKFQTDKYLELCEMLGNGILTMMDRNTGKYYHVLYYGESGRSDFSRKAEYRTVYYDGEATLALAKLYGLTGDEKWLNAAKAAVENFIREDYVIYKDHWVAYAMNEITKYVDDGRYYEFALRNANENLDKIYFRGTSYHTYMELLMATFELYDRMLQNNIKIDYMEKFDDKYFIETIFYRADHMLNGYFYPEYAMYLKKPAKILDTFFVRHDGYRIRIDDVQHFLGGYAQYRDKYDKLLFYRGKLAHTSSGLHQAPAITDEPALDTD
ncbi:glycosyl hydrolase family 88 [Pelotomaculum propionicicum]|uniref:glycosyl hydrolase family 88 n=1 Tax=Pelotomaculum propionicicum TaxID=258475 RepID=UPI003B819EF4